MEWNEHDDSNIFENGILSEHHYVNEWLLDGNMLLKEYISTVTTHVYGEPKNKNIHTGFPFGMNRIQKQCYCSVQLFE